MKLTVTLLALVAGSACVKAETGRRLLTDKVTTVDGWKQCGGVNGCGETDSKPCEDVAWPAYKCADGYECQRQNEWFWQCSPIGDITDLVGGGIPKVQALKPGDFGRYTQCGGNQGACGDYCGDCAWPTGSCEEGFKCAKQSPAYWQCQQAVNVTDDVKVCDKKVVKGGSKVKHVKVSLGETDYDLEDLLAADAPAPSTSTSNPTRTSVSAAKRAPALAPKPTATVTSSLSDITGVPAPAPEPVAVPTEEPTPAAAPEVPVKDPLAMDALVVDTPAAPAAVPSCSPASSEMEIDGIWMTGLFLDATSQDGLFGACCGECVQVSSCQGFQVNLFANGTSFTCELFSKVNMLVPSTDATSGTILQPAASGLTAAVAGRK